jgi:hypothetical protein
MKITKRNELRDYFHESVTLPQKDGPILCDNMKKLEDVYIFIPIYHRKDIFGNNYNSSP